MLKVDTASPKNTVKIRLFKFHFFPKNILKEAYIIFSSKFSPNLVIINIIPFQVMKLWSALPWIVAITLLLMDRQLFSTELDILSKPQYCQNQNMFKTPILLTLSAKVVGVGGVVSDTLPYRTQLNSSKLRRTRIWIFLAFSLCQLRFN